MESPLLAELAYHVTRAGHPTLRINYRGVGASGGAFEEEDVRFDAARAIEHLACSVSAMPIALCGVGLGAALAARCALERPGAVSSLILVGPDPSRLPEAWAGYEGELLIVCGEGDMEPEAERALAAIADRARGRLSVIPRAGRMFQKGLGDLASVVVDALSGPF